MKKITSSLWLKITFLSLILGSFITVSAADYCHTPITSNRGATAYITMKSLGGDQYQFIFESVNDIVSWNAAGSNFYSEVDGVGEYQVSNNLTQDNPKTLSVTITSTPKPNFYVGDFYVNFADGEHMFKIPTDEDFAATCATIDTTPPVMVSASVDGTPTFNSANLLLSATDDTTNPVVTFLANDAANGITNIILTADATGKATITGLSSLTTYNLTITAKDAAGNTSANSKTVTFTTTENTSTECAGSDNVSTDGEAFSNGYNYSFTTSGSDVTLNIELLDTKTGLVAYLWNKTSGFAESGMTNSGGQTFTTTLTGLTTGSQITVAVKFAYAGGMAVTRDFVYTVGNTCTATSVNKLDSKSISIYPTLVKDNLQISSEQEINRIEVKNILGQSVKVFDFQNQETSINLSGISTGNYIVIVKTVDGQLSTQKIVKQ